MRSEKKTGLTLIASVLLAVNTTGCATIINGRTQELAVASTPPGATVKTGAVETTTPGNLTLRRNEDHALVFTKDSFPERQVKVESTTSWWLLGNVLFGIIGGIIGLVVDGASGGGSKLSPGSVDMNMETGFVNGAPPEVRAAEPSPTPDPK